MTDSNISELAGRVSLIDEISKATEKKGGNQRPAQPEAVKVESHFQADPEEVHPSSGSQRVDPEPEAVEAEEEKATPEESAAATIDMIDLAQKTIFAILITRKQKKKYPQKVMNQFISLDVRDMMGEALTPAEEKVLKRYREFESRLRLMVGELSFTKEEREDLMESTAAFCKKHGISVPAGVWFGVRVLETISKRIISLIDL